MSSASAIDPALIEAYRLSRYHVDDGGHRFVLEIDHHAPEIERLYSERGVQCAAFMTASNPFSKPRSKDENQRANQALLAELERAGYACLQGFGKARDSQWAEKSLLALNLSREKADEFGIRYGQNAIVWAGADAIPRLILLR